MPLFLRALTETGKRSFALIDQAASRIIDILHTAIQHPQREDAQSGGVEDVDADTTTSTEVDGGASPMEDIQDFTESSESESLDSDQDGHSDGHSEPEAITEDPTPEQNAQAHPEPVALPQPSTRPRARGRARRVPIHPYMYSAAPFASGTANLDEHLNNSPVRHHRDFLRASTRLPSPASRPLPANVPTPSGSLSPTNAIASGSRPRKRSRGSDADDSSASNSGSDADERPRTRRRTSIPAPACRRSPCLGRHLHLLDDMPARPSSDDEGNWSTAAQASDTEPDPNDAVFRYTRASRAQPRGHRGRKRSRSGSDADESDEAEPSPKRRRSPE